jgi:hypothetical protein
MKILTLLLLLPFLAFSQNCPDDFWKQAQLVGKGKTEFTLEKGQAFKPLIYERGDTTVRKTYIITEKVETAPVVVSQTIDDSNTLIKYNPAWSAFTGSVYQDGTARYTVTIGATATLSFTGNRVEYWAEKRFNHGKAEVSIVRNDGAITTPITTPITTKEVDLYEKRMDNVKALLFDSGVLPQASYTVTIKMTGNKNSAWQTDYPAGTAAQNDLRAKASENNIILDYFKVYRAQ